VKTVPNLKTATVWGSLPGSSDETIFVVAHRDGWFEGANDNASGVATMLGLAEYFAKMPRAKALTFNRSYT
jgi:Zn-dependent M28 family amino/carboxypeptidase